MSDEPTKQALELLVQIEGRIGVPPKIQMFADFFECAKLLDAFATRARLAAIEECALDARRLYDALYAMMYGHDDGVVRTEAFAALKQAEHALAAPSDTERGEG